jgi:hypothetical protein
MGTLKLVIGLSVMVAVIYVGIALIPIYYANYQLQDLIKTEATLQTYTTKPETEIQETIFKKAQDLQIPLSRDQIKVQRHGYTGTGSLSIGAPYVVRVSLPGYAMDLHFDPSTDNKSPF